MTGSESTELRNTEHVMYIHYQTVTCLCYLPHSTNKVTYLDKRRSDTGDRVCETRLQIREHSREKRKAFAGKNGIIACSVRNCHHSAQSRLVKVNALMYRN